MPKCIVGGKKNTEMSLKKMWSGLCHVRAAFWWYLKPCPTPLSHSLKFYPHCIKIHDHIGPRSIRVALRSTPVLQWSEASLSQLAVQTMPLSVQATSAGRSSALVRAVQGTSQMWPNPLVTPLVCCVYMNQNDFHYSSTTGGKKHPVNCNGTFTSVFPQCT